ncbi:MAG: UvrD-helicase domain-containing protein [Thermoguttaceae bacterium]
MNRDRFANVVVRASAGTGKTFQLSNRYLALAAGGVSPDTILATTFTRKAAGEILGRVLVRLAEAAIEPKKLVHLARNLGDPAFDRTRCLRLLDQLVQRVHRLRVSTLDSFFIQVAQTFALELGLPPGWQIAEEIDDARLRGEAIRSLLESQETADVVRLMHLLTKGEASRSIAEQIRLLVNGLYGFFLEAPADAWSALRRHKTLKPEVLEQTLLALEAVPIPGDKRFEKARAADLANAAAGNWGEFVSKGLGKPITLGERQYYGKDIPDEVLAVYLPLAEHARAELVNRIADQTEATQGLLARFHEVYHQMKLRRRSLRFEDVTRLLADSLDDAEMQRIVYRLDARVGHLLLDEFQDTSPIQWHVLRPFATRIVRGSRARRGPDEAAGTPGPSFFCVGDVKQAIYGWRGGVAEIFEALEGELEGLSFDSLEQSWRSSPPVIETVNRVFTGLGGNAALRDHAGAAAHWQRRFASHSTARTELAGHCRLSVAAAAEEGAEQKDATLMYAAGEVARLADEAPGRTIGVLVRTNAAVARMIYELRRREVEASEEGGNPLIDSPAVELLMSLLKLADHPGDTASRFHVAHSPLAETAGLTDHRDREAAVRFSRQTRRRLIDEGYGPVLRGWTEQLAAECHRRDLDRLLQLVELAYAYEPGATMRADDFVEYVQTRRVESPSAARVRVMTVHQSKGLQFDVCVLPELDQRLKGQTPSLVVGRSGPAQPIERICRYVNKDLWPLLPAKFQEMFARYDRQVVEEALCVLYVAVTRAIHSLQMIVPPAKDNEKTIPASAAGLLRSALAGSAPAEPLAILYENGDPGWPGRPDAAKRAEPAEEAAPLVIRLATRTAAARRGLETQSPSQLEGGPRVDLAEQLRLERSAAMDWGTAMHACFEAVEWLDDGSPDDEAIRRRLQALQLPQTDIGAVASRFRRALEKPAVREVLSRSSYPGGYDLRVWRERPFVIRREETILRGTFDRLVVQFDADRPRAADLLDFKSDKLDPGDPAAVEAKRELYRPQLEAYRSAIEHLYGLPAGQITARLVFVESGLVVDV